MVCTTIFLGVLYSMLILVFRVIVSLFISMLLVSLAYFPRVISRGLLSPFLVIVPCFFRV